MSLPIWQGTAQNASGDIIPSASVEVRRESNNSLASLFTTSAGTTSKTNPFTANTNGFADFYTAPGLYKITITGGGNTLVLRNVSLAGTAARANIIGIPNTTDTGALIQYGSNENGEFWRYAGGMQVCIGLRDYSADVNISSPLGGGFRSGTVGGVSTNLPINFVDTQYVLTCIRTGGDSIFGISLSPNLTGRFSYVLTRVTSGTSAVGTYAYIAIGRWK